MIDLPERLRAWAGNDPDGVLMREAAGEIERLIKKGEAVSTMAESYGQALEAMGREIERLRAALDHLTTQRRQDIGQLRAENERLQAALSKAIDELSYTDLRA